MTLSDSESVRRALHLKAYIETVSGGFVSGKVRNVRKEELKAADNAGGPVDRIVQLTRIPRNEPCPCGSGKKFKKCCVSEIDR